MKKLRLIIGRQLSTLRKRNGYTIQELSSLTGMDKANISKIENGKYNISIDIVERICSALGATIKIDIMRTLEELRDYINEHEDWELTANKVIEQNGWTDETGEEYGICNDGSRRLFLTLQDGILVADIEDMQD